MELLRKNCTVVDNFDRPDEVEAIILRVFEVNATIMDMCRNLKVIGKHGVGCNTIDLTEAKKRGITVLNTPGANANSVAELIVGRMLDISRNITLAHNKTQSGAFKKIAPAEITGMELTGKTLGLIGTGNIARRAAEILRNGFGVEQNPAEAVNWLRKSAKQKCAEAYYQLGICYETGEGVERDLNEAEDWYRKALDDPAFATVAKIALDRIAPLRSTENAGRN